MSMTAPQAAIIGLLIHVTVATTTATPSYCFLDPACHCDEMNVSNDLDATPGITCVAKSFSQSDRTIEKLSPEITTLTIICSDPDAESHMTSGIFQQLPVLRHLSIESCNFVTVTRDAFQTASNLKSLEVKTCKFRNLPADVFDTTPRLSRLTVTRCGLKSLPRLCSLLQLTKLNVSGQPLASLDDCVAECGSDVTFQNLTSIDISNCSLTQIPQVLISKAPNLIELHVRDNGIQEMAMENMSLLEVLDALGQELTQVDFMVSDISPHVRVLKLEGNGLVRFPCQSLERLPNLTHVHLERLGVTDDVWAVLPSLTRLTRLALTSNRISFLNLTFHSPNLTHLNLSRNAVSQLDSTTFASQRGLVVIDLSWNNITKVTSGIFVNMSSLQTLNLGRNQIRYILQKGYQNLPSLRLLILSHNNISSLPLFLLREMPGLQYLIVDNNNIMQLPYLTKAPELVEISASNNSIMYLSSSMFSGLAKLEFIWLKGNKLTRLDSQMFLSAPSLIVLDLRNNEISVVESFQRHPKLSFILLDYNKIRDVGFAFSSLPELTALFLDNNELTRLTSSMFPPSLHTLSVTWNRLTYIESAMFTGMHHLRHVNIGGNYYLHRLQLPKVQVSPYLVPKPAFFVGPNLFFCDCQMAYLKVWYDAPDQPGVLQTNLPVFEHVELVECVTYFSGGPVLLKNVPLSDFVCPLKQPMCDELCTCCTPYQTDMSDVEANCTCVLTCPEACTCFHGGSVYARTYTHVLCDAKNLTGFPDFVSPRTTHLRLDGNDLPVVRNTTKLRLVTDVAFLYLNHSEVAVIEDDSFQGLDYLQLLDLSRNKLTQIGKRTFGKLSSLKELKLQHNNIDYVSPEAFSGLAALEKLYLNDNQLREIDTTTLTKLSPTMVLTLSHNPWTCSCEFAEEFLEFLSSRSSRGHREQVADYSTIRCFWYSGRLIVEAGKGGDLEEYRSNVTDSRDCRASMTKKSSERDGTGTGSGSNVTDIAENQEGTGSGTNVSGNASEPGGTGSNNNVTDKTSEQDRTENNTNNVTEKANEQGGTGSGNNKREGEERRQRGAEEEEDDEWCGPDFLSVLMSSYNPRVLCDDSEGIILPVEATHSSALSTTALAIVCVVVVALVLVLAGVLAVKRRKELQAFLYVKLGLRLWDEAGRLDKEEEEMDGNDNAALRAAAAAPYAHHRPRTYDAFVSFSHEDQDFVIDVLLPKLEQKGPRYYKLCVHFRDFPVGESIADSIVDSVESSKRVLLLLSNHFLHSEWCRFEFRAAHQHVLREGGHRLIIILLEDVDQDALDPDLKMALKTRTYLSLKDPWFWEKLMFAMPDVPRHNHDNDQQQQQQQQHRALHRQDPDGAPASAEEEAGGLDGSLADAGIIERSDSDQRVNRVLETLEQDIERDECSVSEIMSLALAGSLCEGLSLSAAELRDPFYDDDEPVEGEGAGVGETGDDCERFPGRDELGGSSSSSSIASGVDCGGTSAGHRGCGEDDVINVGDVMSSSAASDVIAEADGEPSRCSRGWTPAGHLGARADDAGDVIVVVESDSGLCSGGEVSGPEARDCVRTPARDLDAPCHHVVDVSDVNVTDDQDQDLDNGSTRSGVRGVTEDEGGPSIVDQESESAGDVNPPVFTLESADENGKDQCENVESDV